jgi:prolyl 4-hydroxylase
MISLFRTSLEMLVNDNKYVDIKDYDVEEIPNFLTDEECEKIIELSNNKLFPSKIYSNDKDLYSVNSRQSEQCWLRDDIPIIKNISDRVRHYTKTYNNHQEELQVVNYSTGGFFSPHYDPCDGDYEYCKRMDSDNGPRMLTVLFYLNDDFEGGETVFPNINKVVKPQKGKAVIFKSVNNNGVIIRQALHGGEPVKNGNKWIANKWIHVN